tara:strand:+ start:252 stop:545 length:294 start_codon:yes stop_codon:yes gene_type:complete
MGRSNNDSNYNNNIDSKMSREELKRLFLTFPTEGRVVVKRITVEMDKYKDRLGQGTVQITRDGPDGFCEWKSCQSNPMEHALTSEEYLSGEYELIIK